MAFTSPLGNTTIPKDINSDPYMEPCHSENNTWQAGEILTYKVYYNWNFVWIAAGEVVFKVEEENGQYHLSADGRTFKSYEWFFKVRDYYDTYIDKNTLLPDVSIREVHEGKYNLYDKVSFDHQSKKATSLRGKTKEKAVSTVYDVGECMHDVLSVLYYTRNIDFGTFETGADFPVKIFMDKEIWPLNVKYLGREAGKKIRNRGRFNTFAFNPEVILGDIFTEKNKMKVWVSDDKNRLPLMIESPVSVGSVKIVLKEYSGLKYDLTSHLD